MRSSYRLCVLRRRWGGYAGSEFQSFARIYYIRCLFAGNVDRRCVVWLRDQYIIHLPACQSGAYGKRLFVDVSIIGENSGIGAKNTLDQSFPYLSPISLSLYSSSRRMVKSIRDELSCSSVYSKYPACVSIFKALSTGTGKYLNFRQKSSILNSRIH